MVSRPDPAPADCSLATERRAARRQRVGREATPLYNCLAIQLINRSAAACRRGQRLEFRDHAISRSENRMTLVVGSWAMGFSNRRKNPAGLCIFGLQKQMPLIRTMLGAWGKNDYNDHLYSPDIDGYKISGNSFQIYSNIKYGRLMYIRNAKIRGARKMYKEPVGQRPRLTVVLHLPEPPWLVKRTRRIL